MNSEPRLPPFQPILSGERPLDPPPPEPPNWFVRHKALTFVLALMLIVAAAAVAVVVTEPRSASCQFHYMNTYRMQVSRSIL